MIDQFSQFEKLRIGERTKAALHAKKLQGKRVGHIPFGFQLTSDNQHVLPNKLEQAILNKMKELKNAGLSIRKIAKYLNEHNLLNRNNAKFNHASVHRILSSTNKHEVYYHD
ncbi:recombinase family protein [Candidatus Babela massiliensis]|uniref:Site-specific recombinase DNA invertase Pin homolog n=1 Tax=Candidatus Babela massiliensis TaxID=673862 RepID=V6DGW3_9BACT|nr:recombinase family protein [Candidatus Babela massiliensis]CDK30837.1 Site-specific recombinase DNA invertase Pin homolog [Candidatus Babela massiliensis]